MPGIRSNPFCSSYFSASPDGTAPQQQGPARWRTEVGRAIPMYAARLPFLIDELMKDKNIDRTSE